MAIKFFCSECGEPIISKFLKPGDPLNCPFCNKLVEIPENVVQSDEAPNIKRAVDSLHKADKSADGSLDINVFSGNQTSVRSEGKATLRRDFTTLLSIGSAISFLGWIVVAIGAIGFFASFGIRGDQKFFLIALSLLGAVQGIVIVAIGQLISCFVSIERNTHATFMAVENISNV